MIRTKDIAAEIKRYIERKEREQEEKQYPSRILYTKNKLRI